MAEKRWTPESARLVRRRIVVTGKLTLQTPAHLGNGETDDMLDMPLLIDPLERGPLLPGTSIAGALRAYVRAREFGYRAVRQDDEANSITAALFGTLREQEGTQSPLIVDDALGTAPHTVLRDGVRLSPCSRSAADEAKFDTQLWSAGTSFDLRFELILTDLKDDRLLRGLVTALEGFSDGAGGITLGARKRRGYGSVRVDRWTVTTYDLTAPRGLLRWLQADTDEAPAEDSEAHGPVTRISSSDLARLFPGVHPLADQRRRFRLEAELALDGSLLIRSGGPAAHIGADAVHLHSWSPEFGPDGEGVQLPVISGTSLAGALRARALKIVNTIVGADAPRHEVIETLFGPHLAEGKTLARASKVRVEERFIDGGRRDLVQNRIRIDRFTGGVVHGGLFNEQPVFSAGAGQDTSTRTKICLCLEVENPERHEIGLLLLVLKDLWTGDLPIGGESSIGRGRLRGLTADLTMITPAGNQCWRLEGDGWGNVSVPAGADQLEEFVGELHKYVIRGAS